MKTRIEIEATAEIVRQVAPKILDRLQDEIHDLACVSVHRVAGMLEVSPETVKRLFQDRIVHIGGRQQRITLADLKVILDERRTGKRPRAKKRPKDGGLGSTV
jgi:hypothetical protein